MTALGPAPSRFDHEGEFTQGIFKDFIRHCVDQGASDILIQSGDYAWIEVHGRQHPATKTPINHAHVNALVHQAFGADVQASVRGGHPQDRSFQLAGEEDGLARGQVIRTRVNVTQARVARAEGAFSITMRTIPQRIPDLATMAVEQELLDDMVPAKGLVLVCGPTGSGKTTLQASLYQHIGQTMPDKKVITYEDPVEFVLGGQYWKGPQPAQSEIGKDVESFAEALRSGMRRKPSIIGIGEVRDLDTLDAAVEAGQTGHLCYATMHTDSCSETINRGIQLYPPAQQSAIASRLLGALRVIVVQRLLKTTDGRRRAIREFVILDRELRSTLQHVSYDKWSALIDERLRAKGATLDDKAWRLLQEGIIAESEFVELAGTKALRQRLADLDASEAGKPMLATALGAAV